MKRIALVITAIAMTGPVRDKASTLIWCQRGGIDRVSKLAEWV